MDDFTADEIFELLPQCGFNGTESGSDDDDIQTESTRYTESRVEFCDSKKVRASLPLASERSVLESRTVDFERSLKINRRVEGVVS
jgi:hypothetical protein